MKSSEIIKKFPKTELMKVELGKMDVLNKMMSKMIPLQKRAETLNKQIRGEAKQIKKIVNDLKGTLKEAEKVQQDGYELLDPARDILEDIEGSAKELGVDVNDVKGYKEAKKVRNEAFYDYKGLADAYWEDVHELSDEVAALKSIAPL
jgi:hypothetical protein